MGSLPFHPTTSVCVYTYADTERHLLRELLDSGECGSLTEAAYRYRRHEPGIDVVLAGTGSVDHLRQNISDIDRPALPAAFIARLEPLFDRITSLSGQ